MQKLMKMFHKNEKGFTLVELMVVVVIIGILVAIAIPLYGTITRNAEQRSVEANLRTIDGAIVMHQAAFGVGADPTVELNEAGDAYVDLATEDYLEEFLAEWPTGPADAYYEIELILEGPDVYRAVVRTEDPETDPTGGFVGGVNITAFVTLDELDWDDANGGTPEARPE